MTLENLGRKRENARGETIVDRSRGRVGRGRTSLKDDGRWYAVRSMISVWASSAMRRRGWAGSVVSGGRGGTSWRGTTGQVVAAGQRLSCHAGTASPARTWPTTCIADSLILLNAPTRGVVAAVTSVMAVPVGSGDGREGRGDASGWASGSLSWRRFAPTSERFDARARTRATPRVRDAIGRAGRLASTPSRATRARDAAASFARALPIPRPSAAPNEGDRSARPHRADKWRDGDRAWRIAARDARARDETRCLEGMRECVGSGNAPAPEIQAARLGVPRAAETPGARADERLSILSWISFTNSYGRQLA